MTSDNELDFTPPTLEGEIPIEEIVPDHFRQELISMRFVEDRSAWRTGDIALEIQKTADDRKLPIGIGQICVAVAYYRGISAGRVKNITYICKHFPPEKREFARPFSYYEKLYYALPRDETEKALRLSVEIEKRDGVIPSYDKIVEMVVSPQPKETSIGRQVDQIIDRILGLRREIPEFTEVIAHIVSELKDIQEGVKK